jgi:hypothetical protein
VELINAIDLARGLADIASRTWDPSIVEELMVLVDQLFTVAGLPATMPEALIRH